MATKKEKILYIFILCMPIIDLFSSIATWNNWPSIGLVLKGLFLLFVIFYLVKNQKKSRPILLLLFLYGMVSLGISYYLHNSIYQELTNLIKIFYLPTLIIFFASTKNQLINEKLITTLAVTYLLFYTVPYFFNLGHNINEIYPNKNLYLSYFYIGNELANVFILLIPIALKYLIENKKIKLLIPFILLTITMLILLSTKAMYISAIIIAIFFVIYYRKQIKPCLQKHLKITILSLIVITISIVLILPQTSFFKNIKTSLEFYQVDSLTDLITFENIDNIIYSNRLDFLLQIHEKYQESSWVEKIFGIGRSKILQIKDIEIDVFDIFYSIGLLGSIIYVGYFIYAIKQKKLQPFYCFMFVFLGIISLFTGHVLISPMVSTYLAVIYGVDNRKEFTNEKLDQKSIKKN